MRPVSSGQDVTVQCTLGRESKAIQRTCRRGGNGEHRRGGNGEHRRGGNGDRRRRRGGWDERGWTRDLWETGHLLLDHAKGKVFHEDFTDDVDRWLQRTPVVLWRVTRCPRSNRGDARLPANGHAPHVGNGRGGRETRPLTSNQRVSQRNSGRFCGGGGLGSGSLSVTRAGCGRTCIKPGAATTLGGGGDRMGPWGDRMGPWGDRMGPWGRGNGTRGDDGSLANLCRGGG